MPPQHHSQPQAPRDISLELCQTRPLLWCTGVILHESCALWEQHTLGGGLRPIYLLHGCFCHRACSLSTLWTGSRAHVSLGVFSSNLAFLLSPYCQFPPAPFFSSLRTLSQLCSVWLVIASPKLPLRPIVPQSLGSESWKSLFILLLWHPSSEVRMPPGLIDWMKESWGKTGYKEIQGGRKTSVENSNYSILSWLMCNKIIKI